MAQNISITNGVSAFADKQLETCNRPLLIQYTGSGSPYSTLIQIQIQVKEYVGGTLTFVDKGSLLMQSKDTDSASETPKFTFDISSILKSGISKDTDFSIFTTSEPANGFDRLTQSPLMVEYKVLARSWYIDATSGALTLNDVDASVDTANDSLYFCDIQIPDREVMSSRFANMIPSDLKLSGWNLDAVTLANTASAKFAKFLTNCPKGITRKLPAGYPATLSTVNTTSNSIDIIANYIRGNGAGGYVTAAFQGVTHAINSDSRIKTFKINDVIANSLDASGAPETLRAFLRNVTANPDVDSDSYKFLLTNSKRVTTIYFVNDYNVLDFYTFESEVGVSHSHSKQTFKTGYKDYSKRESSKFGVSSGSTQEVMVVSAIVNKETSEWLSEIYRSTNAFVYEVGLDDVGRFCPIRVVDADTIPEPQNKTQLEMFSISFVKDTQTVKI
jgi:hypothetical protein|tara:strand:+ start:3146 stop:4480 length:1335 start_codon:yes stop_codon:yes gene_type:complete